MLQLAEQLCLKGRKLTGDNFDGESVAGDVVGNGNHRDEVECPW